MPNMNNKQMIRLAMGLLMVAFSMLPYITMAQCGDGTDPGGNPDNCPIDGGISLLLAAGVGYGLKRYSDAKKRDKLATV